MRQRLTTKIFTYVMLPVALIFVVTGIFLCNATNKTTTRLTEDSIRSSVDTAASQASGFLSENIQIARQMAANQAIVNLFTQVRSGVDLLSSDGIEQVRATMRNIQGTDKENIISSWIADLDTDQLVDSNGNTPPPGWTIAQSQWYQDVTKAGGATLTDPYVDTATGQIVASAVAPVMGPNGKMNGVVGIDISIGRLSEQLGRQGLGEQSTLVAGNGLVLFHPNSDYIGQQISDIPALSATAELCASGAEGRVEYSQDGQSFVGYLNPVKGSSWRFLTGIPKQEFNAPVYHMGILVIGSFAVGILILTVVTLAVCRGITRPIRRLTAAASDIAAGKLDVQVDVRSSDEIGMVGDAMSETAQRLRDYMAYIEEVTQMLDRMADGHLQIELQCDYLGEFVKIKDSLLHISQTLGETIHRIDGAAELVTGNAQQVSADARSLSEGSINQAAAVQELAATITEASTRMEEITGDAAHVQQIGDAAGENLNSCSGQMQLLNEAISDMKETSGEIGKITKVIEDIAFQTNILALNASVEAARAGAAGKGFAVVADEVRNLATKSAQAAKNITSLIEQSLKSIRTSVDLANEVSTSMSGAVDNTGEVLEMIQRIARHMEEQTVSLQQISSGVQQVSGVVQTNSMTAQQSAAASKELDAQARELKRLVERFELDDRSFAYNR